MRCVLIRSSVPRIGAPRISRIARRPTLECCEARWGQPFAYFAIAIVITPTSPRAAPAVAIRRCLASHPPFFSLARITAVANRKTDDVIKTR
jgi:hypothetical protein